MYYSDGNTIGKPHLIHRQTFYDSAVLMKDTKVTQSLLIFCDQWNFMIPQFWHIKNIRNTRFAEWWWPMKSRERVKWPITRCFFKPIKIELKSSHENWPICQNWQAMQFSRCVLSRASARYMCTLHAICIYMPYAYKLSKIWSMTVLVAVLHSLVKVNRNIFLCFLHYFFLREITFVWLRFLPQLL